MELSIMTELLLLFVKANNCAMCNVHSLTSQLHALSARKLFTATY